MSGPFGSTPHNLFNTTSSDFYTHTINNSIRMSDASNSSLQFTAGTPSSTTTWTMSVWMKKYNPSAGQAANEFFSAGTGGSAYSFLGFTSNQYFVMENESSGTKNKNWNNRVFRDPNAWFHVVVRVNLGESTQDDRLKLYINGELLASTADGLTQTSWAYINANNVSQNWGGKSGIANGNPGCDFYLADINFTDGQSYAPTQFGESKDGVWIPKNPSVTYGDNGYRLEFKQTGVGGASSSTIGADTSGNNNHFTDSGLAAHDFMPDSPTKNWATMNPLMVGGANTQVHSSAAYAEGNLQVLAGGYSTSTIGGGFSSIAIPSDKKIYVEVCDTGETEFGAGVLIQDHVQNNTQMSGNGSVAYYNRSVIVNGTETDYGSSAGAGGLGVARLAAGDVLGIAVDGATGKVWFHRNGTYFKSPSTNNSGTTGDPSAGTNEIGTVTNTTAINLSGNLFFFLTGNSSTDNLFINFGQDSTFAGNKDAGSETDANGEGLFLYAVPTDYVCLHSGNMSDPTIGPTATSNADEHFNTVLWTGNNSVPRNITGVGFSPDWIWVKDRVAANNNVLVDTVRGVSELLYSNATTAGVTGASQISAVGTDGFTIGATTYMNENGSSNTYVGWNWLAGTAFSNDASATSVGTIDSTGQVNTEAGFSIISYTGVGGANQTVAHGLSSTPELIFLKDRDTNSNNNQWQAYHAGAGDDYGYLSTTAAFTGAAQIIPSGTTTFELKANLATTNESGDNYIAYCFHSVEGYSKIGFYNGNNNSDGPFIYTGFRPAWVLFKGDTVASNWCILDNKRSPFNLADDVIQANETNAEATNLSDIDFVSNGIKIRDVVGNDTNKSHTYLYMAFAEAPFKFANAR